MTTGTKEDLLAAAILTAIGLALFAGGAVLYQLSPLAAYIVGGLAAAASAGCFAVWLLGRDDPSIFTPDEEREWPSLLQ